MAADDEQVAALLRTILEAAPALIYAKDLQGRMIIANEPVMELIGKPWDLVEGRTDREFLADAAQGDAVMANDRRILKEGSTEIIEEEVNAPGKAPSVWLSTKTPMRNVEGEVVGLVGISVDITARKRAEDNLRRLNDSLELRVAHRTKERDRAWKLSQDLLLVAHMDSRIEAVSPAWFSILGWEEHDLLDKFFLDFVHPHDRMATEAEDQRLSEGQPTYRFENRYRHKDGSYRWISWTAAPEGGRIYAAGRDITDQKSKEAVLAETEAQLRQVQKMDAIGQLTGGIAHDFNNMLQGIGGSLELMQRRVARGRPEEVAAFIDDAQKAVSRAAALTNRLLAFARRQALAPKAVEPDKIVGGVAELLRRTVGPQIEVQLDRHDGIWLINCDPNELESALINLVINARDAMPDGGRIRIHTRDVELDEETTKPGDDVRPGKYVEVAVSDTGHGMAPDVLSRAFEPFYTTKPQGHGSGLGLSQLYGFVRQSGGMARLESTVGEGTTVRLFLPQYINTAEEVANGLAEQQLAMQLAATVLVVEDEPAVRMMVIECISELGCKVLEACDGPTGLRVIQTKEQIDMLITDVGLPGFNGRQLADMAREDRPELPVVLITGYVGAALDDWELAPGMDVIRKPFTLETLTTHVSNLLNSKKPVSAQPPHSTG